MNSLSIERAVLFRSLGVIMPMVYTPLGKVFDRVSAMGQRAIPLPLCMDVWVATLCGASVYDLTMHLTPLLPRRRL